MKLANRIQALVELGTFMGQFSSVPFTKKVANKHNEHFFEKIKTETEMAIHHNPWFTTDNMTHAFRSWSDSLRFQNLTAWTNAYHFKENPPKTIGLILAGNIPLVGFHDIIAVLISGNKALIKLSSNDQKIIPILLQYLQKIEPEFQNKIEFTEQKLENFDAVIATGSNNSARYFEYYFGKYPHIIRKNRNAVAVLTGHEKVEELSLLGEDIFRYFGLGCRSVSKIFVPKNYELNTLFKALYPYNSIIDYKKYSNNYDYNKAVYLMSLLPIFDNGFLILKEDTSYSSPIATLFYEYYDNLTDLEQKLTSDKNQIQCIIGSTTIANAIPFGSSQKPELWDYADNVDTLDFLLKLT